MDRETREWLSDLQRRLWGNGDQPVRDLRMKGEEFQRVFELIESEPLLTQMGACRFGFSLCISIYDHPVTPGVPPIFLLAISEDHLPYPSSFERINDECEEWNRTDFAWELFSRHTHSDRNRQWLDFYQWEAPRERSHYEY